MWSGHQRFEERLRSEPIAWMTTVSGSGVPSTAPVWFLLEDDESVTVYSKDPSIRLRNLADNPHVTLHLEGNGRGGHILVLNGRAAVDRSLPSPAAHDRYVAKYAEFLERNGWSPAWFAEHYPTPIRMTVRSFHGW